MTSPNPTPSGEQSSPLANSAPDGSVNQCRQPFTPGPWQHGLEHYDAIVATGPVGDGNVVCLPPEVEMEASFARWQSNARLIASAPELYEALRDAANALQSLATGVTDHGSSPHLRATQAVLQEQANAAFAALTKARGEA